MISETEAALLIYSGCILMGYSVGMIIAKTLDHLRQRRILNKILKESGYESY